MNDLKRIWGIASSLPFARWTCWVLLLGCIPTAASAQIFSRPVQRQSISSPYAGQTQIIEQAPSNQQLIFQNAAQEGAMETVTDQQGMVLQPGEVVGGPVVSSPLTLDQCINIGLNQQQTIAAAHASLAAAHAQVRALRNLSPFADLVRKDLPYRRKQAGCGVRIAQAGLDQAVWEARYAITRNYFSALYAMKQEKVAKSVVKELELAEEKAKFIVRKGDPDAVVTQADVEQLNLAIELARLKVIKAETGAKRAKAALREAMGLRQDCPLDLADANLPELQEGLVKEHLIQTALAQRGEVAIAATAAHVVHLEVHAQQNIRTSTAQTFAAGSDIHARQVPQGSTGETYRPTAIGLEMPTLLVGRKCDRVRRVQALAGRANAVVGKTRQLIALEVADAYLKWAEATQKLKRLEKTPKKAAALLKTTKARFDNGAATGEALLRAQTLDATVQAAYNEALYDQALALAALERITAGGFLPNYRQAGIVIHQTPGQIVPPGEVIPAPKNQALPNAGP